jgi:hypothetical protein
MAFSKCKGTILQIDIAATMTTIAQLIEVEAPGMASSSFENVTLDQAGVGVARELTGYTDSDPFTAMIFWDPALAPHIKLNDDISTPVKTTWQVVFANSGATEIDWVTAGLKIKTTVAALDGMKAEVEGDIDGIPVVTA